MLVFSVLILVFTIYLMFGLRTVNQFERRVVFTLGKYTTILEPGLRFVWPFFQSTYKIDLNKNIDELSVELNTLNLPGEVITKILSDVKKSHNPNTPQPDESIKKD